MKTKSIAGAAVLSAAILSWGAVPVYAGHHGGNVGVSGISGGHGGRGSSSSHASGFGSYSSKGWGYSRSLRGYTGGGLGGISANYPRSYSSQRSKAYQNYGSYSKTWTGKQQFSSSNRNLNRSQYGLNQKNRYAGTDKIRSSRTNQALQRESTGFMSKQITTRDGKIRQGNWARNNPVNKSRFDRQTQDKLRNWQGNKSNWADARRNCDEHRHHHHDHDWWHNHCDAIIVWGGGWWGWYDGWWYPAWGYDPYYDYYAYDGPIYGYGGLAPDEVVANVQGELQRLGYYSYIVDGIMGPLTQEALNRYQRDQGLPITGAIDQDTVGSLGLG
jgi:hypothetical protein